MTPQMILLFVNSKTLGYTWLIVLSVLMNGTGACSPVAKETLREQRRDRGRNSRERNGPPNDCTVQSETHKVTQVKR